MKAQDPLYSTMEAQDNSEWLPQSVKPVSVGYVKTTKRDKSSFSEIF